MLRRYIKRKIVFGLIGVGALVAIGAYLFVPSVALAAPPPGVNINLGTNYTVPVQLILSIIAISMLPMIMIMMTSFTRIVIVLSILRQGLGTMSTPPNIIITGVAIILSMFIMNTTLTNIYNNAYVPLTQHKITDQVAIQRGEGDFSQFMIKETLPDQLIFAESMAHVHPKTPKQLPFSVLLTAFVLSQLKIAFWLGIVVYIPLIVIDIVVASGLMSMGMIMVPPTMVSMPLKIIVFIVAGGWDLVVKMLLQSFGVG